MTETDWLSCTSRPADMFRHVAAPASGRKMRLLCTASCRLVWGHLPDPRAQAWVEALEQHADGQIDSDEFGAVDKRWETVYREYTARSQSIREHGDPLDPVLAAYYAVASAGGDVVWDGGSVFQWVVETSGWAVQRGQVKRAKAHVRAQICDLFREVFGNPFRQWKMIPDFLGGGLLQPDGKTVRLTDTARRLAKGIRADQGFDRLPILADALEEAGVTDAEMLAHCRREGAHVRGCWALDVVLGKV